MPQTHLFQNYNSGYFDMIVFTPLVANTVSVQGLLARAAIRTAIAPDRRTQNPHFLPRARLLFGGPTLTKSHARLLFGFKPILRARAYHQGPLTFETASPGLREEQTVEVRAYFESTRKVIPCCWLESDRGVQGVQSPSNWRSCRSAVFPVKPAEGNTPIEAPIHDGITTLVEIRAGRPQGRTGRCHTDANLVRSCQRHCKWK